MFFVIYLPYMNQQTNIQCPCGNSHKLCYAAKKAPKSNEDIRYVCPISNKTCGIGGNILAWISVIECDKDSIKAFKNS